MQDQGMTRRHLLRLGTRVAAGLGVATALGLKTSKPAAAENCVWKKMGGPVCSTGQLLEYWCFRCCGGTSCWNEWCETRIIGSC